MTPRFPELDQLLKSAALSAAFKPLPGSVFPEDAESPERLCHGFQRIFRTAEAAAARDVVFLWVVDNSYLHHEYNKLPSSIVYIEKSDRSISNRWPNSYFKRITRDSKRVLLADVGGLRQYSDANLNWTFYSRLVREHGPLRVWWATRSALNAASGLTIKTAAEWEGHILKLYMLNHGCRPLKNRRGGRSIAELGIF